MSGYRFLIKVIQIMITIKFINRCVFLLSSSVTMSAFTGPSANGGLFASPEPVKSYARKLCMA